MSGKAARDRGLRFERWICNQLKHIYPNSKRHMENQAAEALGYDIDNTHPFRIQAKNHAKYVSVNAIFEIMTDDRQVLAMLPSRSSEIVPVLVTQGRGVTLPPMVVMPRWSFEDFFQLCDFSAESTLINNKGYAPVKSIMKITNGKRPLARIPFDKRDVTPIIYTQPKDGSLPEMVIFPLEDFIKLLEGSNHENTI